MKNYKQNICECCQSFLSKHYLGFWYCSNIHCNLYCEGSNYCEEVKTLKTYNKKLRIINNNFKLYYNKRDNGNQKCKKSTEES